MFISLMLFLLLIYIQRWRQQSRKLVFMHDKHKLTWNGIKPTIVIAHYKEDLSWMDYFELDGFDVEIHMKYYKEPVSDTYKCISVPNVGREAHTYLNYIVEHYHDLPPIILFTMGGLNANIEKMEKFKYIFNNYPVCETKRYCSFPEIHEFDPNFKIPVWTCTTQENDCKRTKLIPADVQPFGKWYRTYINKDLKTIKKSKMNMQATFAVSREAVLQYPLSFYQTLLKQHEKGTDVEVAHYMERSWKAMFEKR